MATKAAAPAITPPICILFPLAGTTLLVAAPAAELVGEVMAEEALLLTEEAPEAADEDAEETADDASEAEEDGSDAGELEGEETSELDAGEDAASAQILSVMPWTPGRLIRDV
jgi:hypothetical protein